MVFRFTAILCGIRAKLVDCVDGHRDQQVDPCYIHAATTMINGDKVQVAGVEPHLCFRHFLSPRVIDLLGQYLIPGLYETDSKSDKAVISGRPFNRRLSGPIPLTACLLAKLAHPFFLASTKTFWPSPAGGNLGRPDWAI